MSKILDLINADLEAARAALHTTSLRGWLKTEFWERTKILAGAIPTIAHAVYTTNGNKYRVRIVDAQTGDYEEYDLTEEEIKEEPTKVPSPFY